MIKGGFGKAVETKVYLEMSTVLKAVYDGESRKSPLSVMVPFSEEPKPIPLHCLSIVPTVGRSAGCLSG